MDSHHDATPHSTRDEQLVLEQPSADWDLVLGDGPVVATAIHDGHAMRDSLLPYLAFTDEQRRRDEDPLTGLLAAVGDVRLVVRTSRFEVDLNRPRAKALSTDPADTWGLKVWKGDLPAAELERSLATHDRFYAMVRSLMEEQLAQWGRVLVLDIHSYNHRRDGADAPPAEPHRNPDIDLGVTTLDPRRWGRVADRFAEVLRSHEFAGRRPDVRENVRYEGGGYFPEWLYATFGERVCTISLEYKKVYMDEWTAQADIGVVEQFRNGLQEAVDAVRGEFLSCR